MTTNTKQFSNYLGTDANGNMRMRLGPHIYVRIGHRFYNERDDGLELVTLETHVARPWIISNFEREAAYQRRKTLAQALQASHIPSYERKAYKRRMGWAR